MRRQNPGGSERRFHALRPRIEAEEVRLRLRDPGAVAMVVAAAKLDGDEATRFAFVCDQLFYLRKALGTFAQRAQRGVRWIDHAVAILTIAATSAGAYSLVFGQGSRRATLVELACVLLLVAIAAIGVRRRMLERWVAQRFLAEFGRVALQVVPLGVDLNEVVDRAARALPAENNPSRPLVALLQERLSGVPMPTDRRASTSYAAQFIAMLDEQIAHHTGAEMRRARAARAASGTVLGAFVVAAVVTTLSAASTFGLVPLLDDVSRGLMFAAIVTPVIGASALLWGVQREDARMAARARRMRFRLPGQKANVRRAKTDEDRAAAILAAAQAMTLESYEWSALMESTI